MSKFTFFISLSMLCLSTLQAQKPLRTVHPDSVTLDDFFWLEMVDSALTLCPSLQSRPVAIKPEMSQLPKLQAAYRHLEPRISLTGCEKGLTDAAGRFKSAADVAMRAFELTLLTRRSSYFDICERAMFNEVAGAWHDPSSQADRKDVAKILSAVPQMVYAIDGKDVYINLLVRHNAHVVTDDLDFKVLATASIPWYAQCLFRLAMDREQEFTLHLRLPGWVKATGFPASYNASQNGARVAVYINGEPPEAEVVDGYYVIRRKWKNGDMVKYALNSPVIRATDKQDPHKVALQRGPLVYAADHADHINPKDGISNDFRLEENTTILTSKSYDAQGQPTGTYEARPYFWNTDKLLPHVFKPVVK